MLDGSRCARACHIFTFGAREGGGLDAETSLSAWPRDVGAPRSIPPGLTFGLRVSDLGPRLLLLDVPSVGRRAILIPHHGLLVLRAPGELRLPPGLLFILREDGLTQLRLEIRLRRAALGGQVLGADNNWPTPLCFACEVARPLCTCLFNGLRFLPFPPSALRALDPVEQPLEDRRGLRHGVQHLLQCPAGETALSPQRCAR